MVSISTKKLQKELWYINAGILSNNMYNNALNFISTLTSETPELNPTLFLTIDYLIQYFELASINSTKLVNECIKQHLEFVEKFVTLHGLERRYLPCKYWDIIYATFDKFTNSSDLIEKQFSIDALERICGFLTGRTIYWVKSSDSFSFLKLFGRKFRNCVVYNSFLIPRFSEYKDPLTYPEQKIFEKIETECNCKIYLDVEMGDCRVGEDSMILEVLFDWYKGNFIGFLDCMLYVVKIIRPKKYFLKSLRTITRNESMCYSILSDLPLKELRAVEKVCRTGQVLSPFLDQNAVSKRVFNLLKINIENIQEDFDRFFQENEETSFWENTLTKLDYSNYKKLVESFISEYQCWLIQCKEWREFKSSIVPTPRPKFSIDEIKSLQVETKEITQEENIKNEIVYDNNENNNGNPEILSTTKRVPKLSIYDIKPIIKVSTVKQDEIKDLFQILHERITKFTETPYDCLNHTLRVILRCDTDKDEQDLQIEKLEMPSTTIYSLLKDFYNFDLKKQIFITPEQRKASFLQRQSLIKKEQEEMQRLQYLELRQRVTEEIEKAIHTPLMSESIKASSKVDSEDINYQYEDIIVDEDILFADFREKKELLSPEFKKAIFQVFGELRDDIIQLFNEKRINALDLWHEKIKNNIQEFQDFFPQKCKPFQCEITRSFERQLSEDKINMIHTSVNTNIFVILKLLSHHDSSVDKEFPKALKGQGMQIYFLDDANKISGNNPKFCGLVDVKDNPYRKELNHNLCVLSFDIYLICVSMNSSLSVIFDFHLKTFMETMINANKKIQLLFKLFEFDDKLEEAKTLFKMRLHNRTKEEIGCLFKLSQDIRRFSEFIFHVPCCKWRQERCIRILYVSMNIDGNKKCQEPFLRKGGDRRLKKIETKNNCIITMKVTTNPTTGVQIPFVEVFYDFFKGNHFCCIDMLRKMLAETKGSTARLINLKHLICFPYGELWIVPDLEWLRTKVSFMIAQDVNS